MSEPSRRRRSGVAAPLAALGLGALALCGGLAGCDKHLADNTVNAVAADADAAVNRVADRVSEKTQDALSNLGDKAEAAADNVADKAQDAIDKAKPEAARLAEDGATYPAGEIFGYSEITRQYYHRYYLPVMHTETNLKEGPTGDEAVNWLWKEWANVLRVRNDGIPILGFTWYSLIDQVDWDTALREDNGNVNPLGLYDLDRNVRAVGRAYKQLIRDWRDVLPTQSVCLVVPIATPHEHAEPWVAEFNLFDTTLEPGPSAQAQTAPQGGS